MIFADDFDAYIIVSFVNATLVLSIGETVEEVTDSGFLGTTPTLSCSALGDDALVQVYPEGTVFMDSVRVNFQLDQKISKRRFFQDIKNSFQ